MKILGGIIMKASKRHEINYRLEGKPFLHLLEGSVYNIPERVEEYDKDMFVVFNVAKQKYEIHSVQFPGDTYQMTVPFDQLDSRIIKHIWQNDISVHGKAIFRRLDRAEEQWKKGKDRKFKNWVQDVASETKSMFAHDAWK